MGGMEEIFDALVVGGGIMGSWTATELLKNGAKKVALVEKVRCY
jgi:glycine/D-amino acid oxidase-like deaminating enzyme